MIKPQPDDQEINLHQDQIIFIKLPGWSPETPLCLTVHLEGPEIKLLLTGPYILSRVIEDIRSSGYSQGLHIIAHEVPHKQFIT